MFKILCFTGVTWVSACTVVDQPVQKGGRFVGVGQSEFAVFTQDETVSAIFLGSHRPDNLQVFAQRALKAISYATKCGIEAGTLKTDGKSFNVVLDCVTSKTRFLRVAGNNRKLGGYTLPELSKSDIETLRYTEGDSLELGPP